MSNRNRNLVLFFSSLLEHRAVSSNGDDSLAAFKVFIDRLDGIHPSLPSLPAASVPSTHGAR